MLFSFFFEKKNFCMSNKNSKNLKFKVSTSSSLVLQTKQILPAAAILRPLVISPTISQKTSCRHFETWRKKVPFLKELMFQYIIHCFELLIGCVSWSTFVGSAAIRKWFPKLSVYCLFNRLLLSYCSMHIDKWFRRGWVVFAQ